MAGKLSDMSLEDLEAAMEEKRGEQREALVAERNELLAKVAEVEAKMADLGMPGYGRKRGPRAKNSMTMREAITRVLSKYKNGAVLNDVVEGVKKLGYVSKAANFKNVVYQTLYNNDEFVKGDDGKFRVSA